MNGETPRRAQHNHAAGADQTPPQRASLGARVAARFAQTTLPPTIAPLHAIVSGLALAALFASAGMAANLISTPLAATAAPEIAGAVWPATALFALLFFTLQKQGFIFHWRNESTKISLDEIALFLGALALPPAHIVLGVAASSAINQLIHRRDLAKGTFNVAQYVVGATAAVIAVSALRHAGAPAPWPSVAAPLAFSVVTALLVSALFSRMGEGSVWRIFRDRFGGWAIVGTTLGVSLGLIVYALYVVAPIAVLAAVPIFFYLRRFGRLSEWADDELKTHKLLAAVSVEVAGRSDLDTVARRVLRACNELFDCGEAHLVLGPNSSHSRAWRETFGASGAGAAGGITTPVQDAHGARMGELTVFPRPGQRPYGEREHHLLRTVAANAAAAAANARALKTSMDANAQLLASERRYRSLFETANVFIHIVDEHANVLDMNPAAFATLGYRGSDVINHPLRETLVPAEEDAPHPLDLLLREGELRGVEAKLRTARGETVQVLLDAQELDDDDTGGARYVISSRDVTSLHDLASELRASMAHQRETIRRLENMNRELEEFTLWTTHDMREPLRSIGTIAQFLHEDVGRVPPDEARDMARRICDGAERLKERVKALHAFSLIVQRDDAFEDVALQHVVEDVVDSLETRIRESNADVRLPDERLPTVRAQPQRIHQVFANLIENALKYARTEHPIVTIGFDETAKEWRFHVRDNGQGIPPAFHDRIFHLFQRGPDANASNGSGAGLAIVKRIAEQHGGRAWVESAPGQGACFYIALPRAGTTSEPEVRTLQPAAAKPT